MLTASAADLGVLADTTRAAAAAAIITKGLGILKFVTTTGPENAPWT